MNYSYLQPNSCRPRTILSYKEFTNFEQTAISQRMQQADCEWGWFCTAEDEHNPNAHYPVPIMNYTHKKSSHPIVVNTFTTTYEKGATMSSDCGKKYEGPDNDIVSKKIFYYLSHCALFSVIILISTYA